MGAATPAQAAATLLLPAVWSAWLSTTSIANSLARARRERRGRCARTWAVATFLVVLRRSGPRWDRSRPLEEQSDWPAHAAFMDTLVDAGFVVLGGPLADEDRVVHAVEAESEDAVRATLARDPWSETHLRIDTIDAWTIRLDGRRS